MSLARVQFFSVSLDGFGTGEPQSLEAPFGHAGDRLHEWMFKTRWWHANEGQPGGSAGIDDAFLQQFAPGIGAEIMGANKFGPSGWHEDPEWKGWWGPNPPFHTPVFVLTHHTRTPIEMEGGTTFHFVDASPAEALATAKAAAGGQDVRLGGGATMIREFLAAGLVDYMHITVVPILLGRGVRLWDGLESLEKGLRDRGHHLAQRGDARDVHPKESLIRRSSMKARLVGFGEIEVDGKRYDVDVVIEAGEVRRRRKKPSKPYRDRFGHTPLSVDEVIPWDGPTLIVGTGANGRLPIMAEVYGEVVALSTESACRLIADLEPGKVNAILHVTC